MHQESPAQQLSSRAHGAPSGIASVRAQSGQNLYFHDIRT
jgi:hypothetical protein